MPVGPSPIGRETKRPDWTDVKDEPVAASTEVPAGANKIGEQRQASVATAPATEETQALTASAPSASEQAQAQVAPVPESQGEQELSEEQAEDAADFGRDRSRSPSAGTYHEEANEESTPAIEYWGSWADNDVEVTIPSGTYQWDQILEWAAEVGGNPRRGSADLLGVPNTQNPGRETPRRVGGQQACDPIAACLRASRLRSTRQLPALRDPGPERR